MLIGLTGYARSGKDSAFAVLEEVAGFEKFAFADALRQVARGANPAISLDGAPIEVQAAFGSSSSVYPRPSSARFPRYAEILDTVGYEKAKSIPDFRLFLQRLGTEGLRDVFGETVWIDALHRNITLRGSLNICITDVRFHNEARYIHEQGGSLWRIVRPGYGGKDSHPSESFIPELDADVEITADSLDELRAGVIGQLAEEVRP